MEKQCRNHTNKIWRCMYVTVQKTSLQNGKCHS